MIEKKLIQPPERQYQNVVLTFDDGTIAVFSGKAVCFPNETKRIRNIEFTEPKELPADCSFSDS